MMRLFPIFFFLLVQAAIYTTTLAKPFATVYAAGDIADCQKPDSAKHSQATAHIIQTELARNPSAIVLTIGDHTYPIGRPEEFKQCYDPTWGQFKNKTYPSPGNHEYYMPKAYGYFEYFGEAAGSQKHPYYSFNKGTWHIISLDSNLKNEQQQAQLAWLESDLKKNKSSCILAYWHHPVYSSGLRGNYSQMNEAWNKLLKARADIVLSAHDHYYERFAPQTTDGTLEAEKGIREFIVGTGGAHLTPSLIRKPNSEVLNTDTYGVLQLRLYKNSYRWSFMAVHTDPDTQPFSDKGEGECHKK